MEGRLATHTTRGGGQSEPSSIGIRTLSATVPLDVAWVEPSAATWRQAPVSFPRKCLPYPLVRLHDSLGEVSTGLTRKGDG